MQMWRSPLPRRGGPILTFVLWIKRTRLLSLVAVVIVMSVGLLYSAWPRSADPDGGHAFTVSTAILIAGYLTFPILALLAIGLLLVALLLVVGQVIEGRRPPR